MKSSRRMSVHTSFRVLALMFVPVVALAASYPVWKPLVRQNRWFVIASNIGLDSLRRLGLTSGQIGQEELSSPPESKIPTQLAHLKSVYEEMLQHSGIQPGKVSGARVIELGPGFTMTIPLLFAADGASYAVGVDKFVPFLTSSYYQHYYAQMRESLPAEKRERFDAALNQNPLTLNEARVRQVYKKELQDIVPELGPGTYDLIVSNAVMEEIYEPTPSFEAQVRLLRPGGVMVHNIDLRDYGMFTDRGFHPLEYLTVSDWVYQRMVEASGQQSRRLAGYYRQAATRLGLEPEIYITRVLNHPDPLPEPVRELRPGIDYTADDLRQLNVIRPRLQPQFRNLPDSELLAQSIIFVARKPATPKAN